MQAALLAIIRTPALAAPACILLLYAVFASTIAPYQSMLAVEMFGLSHRAYAALMVAAALVVVTTSVTGGIWADQWLSRRLLAFVTTAAATAGALLVWVMPGKGTFILAHALFLPMGGTIFGQCFALARLGAAMHPETERAAILALVRALFAAPFVFVLPLWSFVFRAGAAVTAVYPVLAMAGLLMLALILVLWPQEGRNGWSDPKGGLRFLTALRDLTGGGFMVRVALLGVVSGALGLYMALAGLSFAAAGRPAGDVALYVGFVAGAEVPFMLALPRIQPLLPKATLIAAGICIYAVHLALMPVLAPTAYVWALVPFAAAGGAAILILPISYLQDLTGPRAGAGAALLALQRITGDATAALAFATGTALSGYSLAAFLGAAAAVTSGLFLAVLDRRAPPAAGFS